jgi:hypothetical protein
VANGGAGDEPATKDQLRRVLELFGDAKETDDAVVRVVAMLAEAVMDLEKRLAAAEHRIAELERLIPPEPV